MKEMKIELAERISYDFDGNLTDENKNTVVINCRIWPPLIGGDIARIELSIPTASMPLPEIDNPCHINGKTSTYKVWLDNVWYRQITTNNFSNNTTSLNPIILNYVGKLRLDWHKNQSKEIDQSHDHKKRIKFFLNKIDFLADDFWPHALLNPSNKQSQELYTVHIPQLGQVKILREWVLARSINPEDIVVRSGFCGVVDLEKDNATMEEYLSHFEDALMIMSVFCRQRITVHGWEIKHKGRLEQIWKDPLNPITTKSTPYESNNYLVNQRLFASLTTIAVKNFEALETKTKKTFKLLTIGLVPFVNMNDSTRFLSMYQALEYLSNLAKTIRNDTQENEELISALEKAKEGLNENIIKRIDGFIRKVIDNGPSVIQKLESVLSALNVKTNDLWPLSGTTQLPGLKELRNKLAHKGPRALNHQSLAVATMHLSLLIERVLINLLSIPIENTSVTSDRLNNYEEWYKPTYWKEQQKNVFSNKK